MSKKLTNSNIFISYRHADYDDFLHTEEEKYRMHVWFGWQHGDPADQDFRPEVDWKPVGWESSEDNWMIQMVDDMMDMRGWQWNLPPDEFEIHNLKDIAMKNLFRLGLDPIYKELPGRSFNSQTRNGLTDVTDISFKIPEDRIPK